MVNIQAIIYITNEDVKRFNDLASYRTFCYTANDPRHQGRLSNMKDQAQRTENQLAQLYNLDPECMKGAITSFGSVAETRRRLSEDHIRYSLCNHDNKVTISIQRLTNRAHNIITTIFRPFDYEVICCHFEQPEPNNPHFEP